MNLLSTTASTRPALRRTTARPVTLLIATVLGSGCDI
jgi:hypothetical protein